MPRCVPLPLDADLHCDGLIIYLYLLGKEVCPNGCLVLLGELLLDILVHQTGLHTPAMSHTTTLQSSAIT